VDSEYITVEWSRSAEREVRALSDSVRQEVIEEIRALEDDPFSPGSKALRAPGQYSIRVCDQAYRVVYRVSKRRRIAYAGL
jgi:mRNA-degrading endonuclease RelE of RelBE toxin-antitoxin system